MRNVDKAIEFAKRHLPEGRRGGDLSIDETLLLSERIQTDGAKSAVYDAFLFGYAAGFKEAKRLTKQK